MDIDEFMEKMGSLKIPPHKPSKSLKLLLPSIDYSKLSECKFKHDETVEFETVKNGEIIKSGTGKIIEILYSPDDGNFRYFLSNPEFTIDMNKRVLFRDCIIGDEYGRPINLIKKSLSNLKIRLDELYRKRALIDEKIDELKIKIDNNEY